MTKRVLLLSLAALLLLTLPSHDQDQWSAAVDKARNISDILQASYYKPLVEDELVYASIRGALDTLDPHSYFLDPESFSRFTEDYRGKYFGLGIQIQKQGDNIVVVSPIEGTPAWRLGIRPGDIIATINGESTVPISSFEAMQKLRGEKGTKVTITIVRDGLDKPLEFTITREEIPLLSVPYAFMLDKDVGYIYIRNFAEHTPAELEAALTKLKGQGMRDLILDLRLNGGGPLAQCIEMTNLFLPRGELVVSMKGRNPEFDREFRTERDGAYDKMPLVILIDGGSASASEILSGAIMDHDRGLIVGEDSFGKGLVQTVFPLTPNAAVGLTIARYLTPSGRSIQRDYTQIDEWMLSKRAPEASREIKYTDHGRKVLGEGGITPDYKVDARIKPFTARLRLAGEFFSYARKLVQHQTDLGKRMIFPEDQKAAGNGGGGTAQGAGKILAAKPFVINDAVMADFKGYLQSRKVTYDEKTFAEAEPEIKYELERECTGAIWGLDEGIKVSRQEDPVVIKALEVMPEAAKFAAGKWPLPAKR